jgi:nucleoid-associated protein YgaU
MVAIAYHFDERPLRPVEDWPCHPAFGARPGVGKRPSSEPLASVSADSARATTRTSDRFRRRRVVVLAVVALVVVPIMAVLATSPPQPTPAPAVAAEPLLVVDAAGFYVAQPGDTLWTIAQRLVPGTDPRPLVDRLAQLNGGASIHAGQRILLE